MIYAKSEDVIRAKPEEVYRLLKDITMWPEIFPPCQKAKVLSFENNIEMIELTALTKGKLFSWTSKRVHNDKEMNISFQQTVPTPPLVYMKGTWHVEPEGENTKVILIHEFRLKWNFCEKLLGMIARKFFVDSNSEREIKGLKEFCERSH